MQEPHDEPVTTGCSRVPRQGDAAVRISGPPSCRVTDPPPRFTVEAGREVLFMVELAAARHLMTSITDRTPDNYFYGGDLDGGFAVDREWRMPQDVWGRLCRLPELFYRVVAFDQVAGESTLSVDDCELDRLPVLRLDTGVDRPEPPPPPSTPDQGELDAHGPDAAPTARRSTT